MTMNWRPFAVAFNSSGDNCGTGAGGFRPGNDCARGKSPGGRKDTAADHEDSHRGLAKALGMANARKPTLANTLEVTVEGAPAAGKFRRKLLDNASSLGFRNTYTENTYHTDVYYSPESHRLRVAVEVGPLVRGKRVVHRVSATLEYTRPEHREGAAVSRNATEATNLLPWNVPSSREAFRSARLGDNLGAVELHEQAIENLERNRHRAVADISRKHWSDAMAAHMVARDYHMEKAGLQ